MISAALSLALVVGTAFNTGALDQSETPTINQAIDIRIDVYGFNAVNTTTKDHVLVFGYGQAQFIRVLPQGETLSWPLSGNETRGVTLEILTPGKDGWTTSTAVSIDLQALTGNAPLIMSANSDGLTAWKSNSTTTSGKVINASASLGDSPARPTPSYSSMGSTSTEQMIFHVPSVTGLDDPKPQRPPVIDDEPLPAI